MDRTQPPSPNTPPFQTTSPPTFQLMEVTQRWNNTIALNNLRLIFHPGESIALIGPSGSGKSTLLRLLAGSLQPSSGSVLVNGQDLNQYSHRQLRNHRKRCSFLHQTHPIFPGLNVHQNVLIGLLPHWPLWKITWSRLWPLQRDEVATFLRLVGIPEKQWSPAQTLSGGQQQRVAIARALIHNPHVLLADEPTSALDPETSHLIAKLLTDYARQTGATFVWSTHHFSLAQPHVQRVIGIREGQVLLDQPTPNVTPNDLERLYKGTQDAPH